MSLRTAQSKISSAVQRRNALNSTPATLTRAFVDIKDSFYFATKHTVSENLRVLLRIALKLSKKTLSIGVSTLVNSLPIKPKVFK